MQNNVIHNDKRQKRLSLIPAKNSTPKNQNERILEQLKVIDPQSSSYISFTAFLKELNQKEGLTSLLNFTQKYHHVISPIRFIKSSSNIKKIDIQFLTLGKKLTPTYINL